MLSLVRLIGPAVCLAVFSCLSFAQTPTVPDFLLDHNRDGVIDAKDLMILVLRWKVDGIVTPTPSPTSSATPTPSATATATTTDTPTPSATPTLPNSFPIELPVPTAPTPPSIQLIRIPAGSFLMGSPGTERGRDTDEGPQHEVTIDYDFYMSQTEVTQAQWQAVMGSIPPQIFLAGLEGPNRPLVLASWNNCQEFIAALNAIAPGTFRLPSEAEWEYACRAGSIRRFYYGNSLGCNDLCENCDFDEIVIGTKGPFFLRQRVDYMWYCANATTIQDVKALRPNLFGLYDMSGNAREFVQDSYHSDYIGAPTDGSARESEGVTNKVHRGGAASEDAADCRSAARAGMSPTSGSGRVGFRLVWTP